MQTATLDQIHAAYVTAVNTSNVNVTEITQKFLELLQQISVEETDLIQFNNFINGVERCYQERLNTFNMTTLCEEILFCSMYVLGWLNATRNHNLDVCLIARRKGLESHLTKILDKATHNKVTNIYDLFGIRVILLNEENSLDLLYQLNDTLIGILTKLNRRDRLDFMSWIDNNKNIDEAARWRILNVLRIPFELQQAEPTQDTDGFNSSDFPGMEIPEKSHTLYPNGVKDYVYNPKENGYQSLHFILRVAPSSHCLPGVCMEFQFRTAKMHKHATVLDDDVNNAPLVPTVKEADDEKTHDDDKTKAKNSKKNASHKSYKDELAELRKLFTMEDVHQTNLRAFYAYGSSESDLDGVGCAKLFYNRRINDVSF